MNPGYVVAEGKQSGSAGVDPTPAEAWPSPGTTLDTPAGGTDAVGTDNTLGETSGGGGEIDETDTGETDPDSQPTATGSADDGSADDSSTTGDAETGDSATGGDGSSGESSTGGDPDSDPDGCVPLSAGAVAWWPAEEKTAFEDILAGFELAAVAGEVTLAEAWIGTGFLFDGLSILEIVGSDLLDFEDDFSVEFWLQSTRAHSGFILNNASETDPFDDRGYGMARSESGTLTVLAAQTVLRGSQQLSSGDSFHHCALVRASGEVLAYIDGRSEAVPTGSRSQLGHPTPLRIGANESGDLRLEGVVDELTFYDRALSPFEISEIVRAAQAGKCRP